MPTVGALAAALVLRDGRFLDGALEAQRATRDEVMSALRAEGRADVVGVGAAALDTDGSMSVLDGRPGHAARPTLFARS